MLLWVYTDNVSCHTRYLMNEDQYTEEYFYMGENVFAIPRFL